MAINGGDPGLENFFPMANYELAKPSQRSA
jgi:hypothetical protein